MRTVEMSVEKRSYFDLKQLASKLKERLKKVMTLPDPVGVLMQKYRQFGLENKNPGQQQEEAKRLYPLILSSYRTGITDFKICARLHGLPFSGELTHQNYPNVKLVVKGDECSLIYSTRQQNEHGINGDYVEVWGSTDGKEVYSVRYGRWANGIEEETSSIVYESPSKVVRITVH